MDGKRLITGKELYQLYSHRFAYRRLILWEHEQPHARRQWSSLAADVTELFTEKLLASKTVPAALAIQLQGLDRGAGTNGSGTSDSRQLISSTRTWPAYICEEHGLVSQREAGLDIACPICLGDVRKIWAAELDAAMAAGEARAREGLSR